MESTNPDQGISLFERLGMAVRVLFNEGEARRHAAGLQALAQQQLTPPPERVHASGLVLLGALQREGRLLDFLQQEIAGFSDEEVATAARVIHGGCRKIVRQYLDIEPVATEPEGGSISVPKGFDANRFRLTGNVAGQPPFRGTLTHHGWVAKQIRLPVVSEAIDPRILAPAEVKLD